MSRKILLNEKLKKLREIAGYKQDEIAQVLGVNRTTYTYYESGKLSISLEKLEALAKIYHMTAAELLGDGSPSVIDVMVADDTFEYDADKGRFTKLSKDEKMLVLYYRQLDEKKKKRLMNSIQGKV